MAACQRTHVERETRERGGVSEGWGESKVGEPPRKHLGNT